MGVSTPQPTEPSPSSGSSAPAAALLGDRPLRVGRDPSNDIVIDHPSVSRFHAEIVPGAQGAQVRDLSSHSGTRLNGEPVTARSIAAGDQIGIGTVRLLVGEGEVVSHDEHGALHLEASGLSTVVGRRTILDRVSLHIEPGQLVAIIGESGSGKSTLIKALAGVSRTSEGVVRCNGDSVLHRLHEIGYVPQDDIVHGHLTVREALSYSARLRLPDDSTAEELTDAVKLAVAEVALDEHADTRIGSLSGGQRKRAGVATELLAQPSLLFLDEPTSGLDPGLETTLMHLFRTLAEPGRRAVVLVTHATKNLGLVDQVVVMGRGGEPCFVGRPDRALEFFGVEDFDQIYLRLGERPASEWRARFDSSRATPGTAATEQVPGGADGARRAWRQAAVLTARYAKLLARDRRNLLILLGQVPVIALAISLLFRSGVLDPAPRGRPLEGAQLLFLLMTNAIWFGSIDAARELIKERALATREAAVGVRLWAYLLSKALVLFTLVTVQVVLLAVIVFLVRPPHESFATLLGIVVLLILTGCVAVSMGLLISAVVSSEDQAASFTTLALIPQLLFAGAIVSVRHMGQPMGALSNVFFARWSFASIGSAAHMNARIAGDPIFSRLDQYGSHFFTLGIGAGALILVGFGVALLLAVAVVVGRREHP
jgi:ABC-type multidrug transport system ATPase subunit